MQRISFWLFLVATLYVSSPACATGAGPASSVPAYIGPHIALLLPLKSPAFGSAADAVRQGFLAAAGSQPQGLPVKVYECKDESPEILGLYVQALKAGAVAIAGPLTRDGAETLANFSGIVVPTLALNAAEKAGAEQLYFFGLPAEREAHQIAQLAAVKGLKKAIIIGSGTPLSARLSLAFAEEWEKRGGSITREIVYRDDAAVFAGIQAEEGSMVFLAADAETARLIRPYLDIALPVYSTSYIFSGNANVLLNYDLNDIRFVDMPWLLQSDHPAVMVYPRAAPPLSTEKERLYAMGIDAYRLLQIMLGKTLRTSLPLDGVTGRITLNENRQFEREGVAAQFRFGLGLTPEAMAEMIRAAARAAAASSVPEAMPASGVAASAVPAQ